MLLYCKTTYKSPIGNITLASDCKENLIGLWFEGQKYFAAALDIETFKNNNDLEIFYKTKLYLDRYFNFEKPDINELSLAPVGSEFRQQVWEILCKIPYGEIVTYSDIARQIAKKRGLDNMSARAIGMAVAHNPISIIIPCHRVVGKNGNLTGYAAGIKTKIKLLTHEGVNMNNFFVSAKSTAL